MDIFIYLEMLIVIIILWKSIMEGMEIKAKSSLFLCQLKMQVVVTMKKGIIITTNEYGIVYMLVYTL